MLAGDFNMIYSSEDKNNDNINRAMMGRFRRFVNDLELKEIPLLGRRYTWSNERESPTLVKLDRVLCTNDWEDIYPESLLQSQATEMSDHCPLILGLKEGILGKRRFHFESFWPNLPGFHEAVLHSWEEPVQPCCCLERISIKLKRLTRALQSWSQKQTGNIKEQLALARHILHHLEMARDHRLLSDDEDWLRRKLKSHCLALASLERTIARLRSRVRYLKDGDANTSFFHKQARFRKYKNYISKLKTEDHVVTTQQEKHQILFDFFDGILGTAAERTTTLNLEAFHRAGFDLSALDTPFSETEVWTTISSLPADRAPGPDGFIGKFYKSCWSIIKTDFMVALMTLQQGHARKLELLNSAYLTLIPKKAEALEAKDYRPISLVHSFAKLVTKLMANRLAPLLDNMVASDQSAFIRGRCIHDNFMLVQQTIKVLHRRKVASLFLKLDISKAFDSVAWPFLLEILSHLGFGPSWCTLIANLLKSASTQIILNGEPGDYIYHQRGLRQGDPLSPMLFILVMDVLNSLFAQADLEGLLKPLQSTGQRLSLYADDVALFIHPDEADLQLTKSLLEVFGNASGLHTNLHKSNVIPIKCDRDIIEVVSGTLQCTTASFPSAYLGLPISDKKLRKGDLMTWIEQKIANKLPGWKASLMSLSGRAVMVRFVLSAVLIYLLVALKVPKWFIKAIDKIRRSFLWKGRKEVNGGCCLVAWEKVMRPLELGGLGIHNLEVMGWALQMRWLWIGKTKPDRPWAGLEIPVHSNTSAMFAISVVTNVGNGENTLFWSDHWLLGENLEKLAPNVVKCVPPKIRRTRTVADALLNLTWVSDIKGALGWLGLVEYLQLWDLVSDFTLNDLEDVHHWKLESSGSFSTKSAYRAFFFGSITFEPWKRLWKSWAPGKCKTFIWLAIRNRCWTADRLQKRGLPHPDHCPLCDQEEETVQHILTTCVFARQFWFAVLQPLNLVALVPSRRTISLADWWLRAWIKVPKQHKKGFNSLVMLGAWIILKHRYACVFDGSAPCFQVALRAYKEELQLWIAAGDKGLRALGVGQVE